MSMTTRDVVAAFADRLERRDWAAFAELLAPDVMYEIPQTRERIRGRDRYVTFNAEFPGDWHLSPRVVLADERNGVLLFDWTLDGETSPAMAFFEFDGSLITKITDFWPEPYEPPSGREHLVERW
jgi:SnoaL-like domain